ncbi:MAG: nuclear transport factor 2 family protein [Novosphingobium sp.]|nr:nuclear transport factor 2 family protein [Novosphingobium sp.]
MAAIDIQTLIDRAAISDVVIAYATAVDTRDWDLLRSLFTDHVFYDFRTFDPDLYAEISVDELVERAMKLAAFDSTQHISSNHRHTIVGDRATCVSYMQASHFLARDGESSHCILYGFYTNDLVRTGQGWKIDRYALTVTGQTGDPRVFEWAGFF